MKVLNKSSLFLRLDNHLSAGGQDEQPWEVYNSISVTLFSLLLNSRENKRELNKLKINSIFMINPFTMIYSIKPFCVVNIQIFGYNCKKILGQFESDRIK